MSVPHNRLYRSRTDRMVGGVAGGLGDYFEIDPTIVRVLFIVATLLSGGLGLLLYVAMCLIVPLQGEQQSPLQRFLRPSDRSEGGQEGPMNAESTTTSQPNQAPEPRAQRQSWAGIILIALGLLFLANNLNWFWWMNWRFFWPALLIVIGVALLARR